MAEFDDVVQGGPQADDAAPGGAALLSWGDLQFAASSGYAAMSREALFRHAAVERLGARPQRHWLGPGEQTATLSGVTFPAWASPSATVDAMRAAAAAGEARLLLDGLGAALGRWALLRVSESWAALHADGRPRRIEWSLELARAGDDGPDGEMDAARQAADEAGSGADVIEAAASAGTVAEAVAAAEAAAGDVAAADPNSLRRRILDAVRTAAAVAGATPADLARRAIDAAARLPGAPTLLRPVASTALRAAAGDTLDAIAARRYGSSAAVGTLLAANPSIAGVSAALPAGALVGLPREPVVEEARQVVQLWT